MIVPRALVCVAVAASAVAAFAAPPAQPIVVQGLDCRGDDPGWRLDVTRTTAQFSTATPRKREVVFRGTMQAMSAYAPAAIVWRGDSTHLPRDTIVLTAREEACKGTLPGTHRAVLSIRAGEASAGCCVVRAGYDARVAPIANLAAKGPDDWSRSLADLLPAINACAARDGAKLAAVAGAAIAGPGSVRVRIIETGGAAIDCTVDASGRGAAAMAGAASPGTPGPGPLFYPAREPPPLVACGKLERVMGRGGLAGYLHYDPC